MRFTTTCVALLALAAAAAAIVPADEITSLPGWNGPLPSRMFSGYMPVSSGDSAGFLHYWLVFSENQPSTDPLVLWFNGGPGSSSLIGLLTENGPFQLDDDSFTNSSSLPQLQRNPYGWQKAANMLYFESPKGVGFSYCVNRKNCTNTDESTASDSYDAIVAFLKAYPEFASHDVYITGESYAGIYIPMFMDQIRQRGGVNLKGAAIGDGCWGNKVGTCSLNPFDSAQYSHDFFFGHGMVSQSLAAKIAKACKDFSRQNVECDELLLKEAAQLGDFDIYNVYDDCGEDQVDLVTLRKLLAAPTVTLTNHLQSLHPHPHLRGALNDYTCGAQRAMGVWLSSPAVHKALHVIANQSGMTYMRTVADLQPLYKELVQKYRVVIYSGDVDACVPYTGSQTWTRNLGFPVVDDWRPWHSGTEDKPQSVQRAGYVITYGLPQSGFNFTYMTIAGAGHMAPQFKPVRSLAMFERFLENKPM